ncbi:MAG: 1-acyl-sn-glycerol-3-phosphate acyltransferase [Methylobacteriaceae bacterium]|jgi:1-acyl-sn-glycerol-3-phosphate acyltransferase|nr:1-acyl-sn-glycerol-3-phosphate acyltransferase [Methylobacteriaceae bacterium]
MVFVRAIVFNILFYSNLILWMVVFSPALLGPRPPVAEIARRWARSSLALLRLVVGVDAEFRHTERIPAGGILVASKHQSFWETFALFTVLPSPVFILKRELMWIPFFGWYLAKIGCIGVNRQSGELSAREMVEKSKRALAENQQLVIFPEGTRKAPGAPPDYKRGVAMLYRLLKVPCQPVALNSGLFWPRRKLIRRRGVILVEFCPVIPAGIDRDAFLEQVQRTIEDTTASLLHEGRETLY